MKYGSKELTGEILFLNDLKEYINSGMSKNDLKTLINQRIKTSNRQVKYNPETLDYLEELEIFGYIENVGSVNCHATEDDEIKHEQWHNAPTATEEELSKMRMERIGSVKKEAEWQLNERKALYDKCQKLKEELEAQEKELNTVYGALRTTYDAWSFDNSISDANQDTIEQLLSNQ